MKKWGIILAGGIIIGGVVGTPIYKEYSSNQEKYEQGLDYAKENSIEGFNNAISVLSELDGFKNSNEWLKYSEEELKYLENEAKRLEEEKEKKYLRGIEYAAKSEGFYLAGIDAIVSLAFVGDYKDSEEVLANEIDKMISFMNETINTDNYDVVIQTCNKLIDAIPDEMSKWAQDNEDRILDIAGAYTKNKRIAVALDVLECTNIYQFGKGKLLYESLKSEQKIQHEEYNKTKIEQVKREAVPKIGMTREDLLLCSWGKPEKINKTTTKYGVSEQFCYSGYKYVYVEDGIVTAIQE